MVSPALDHCIDTTVLPGLVSSYFLLLDRDRANSAVNRPLPDSDSELDRRRLLRYRVDLLRATETSARH